LNEGDAFIKDDNVFIKIEPLEDNNGILLNAIDLKTGIGCEIASYVTVLKCNAKVNVKFNEEADFV
jgi:hypothetical protein